jgi:DNA-binding response OmpR family regulator
VSIKPKILLVDDEESTRFSFVRFLTRSGLEVFEAEDLIDASRQLAQQTFDADRKSVV